MNFQKSKTAFTTPTLFVFKAQIFNRDESNTIFNHVTSLGGLSEKANAETAFKTQHLLAQHHK